MSAPSLCPSIEISPSVGLINPQTARIEHGLARTVYPLKPDHGPRVNLDGHVAQDIVFCPMRFDTSLTITLISCPPFL